MSLFACIAFQLRVRFGDVMPLVSTCAVVACCIKNFGTYRAHLSDDDMEDVLALYQEMLRVDLQTFHGKQIRNHPASAADPPDDTLLLFSFHTLADALAWAQHVQRACLQQAWPECLATVPGCKPVWFCDTHSVPIASAKLFSGPQVAIAVTEQQLENSTTQVCPGVQDVHVFLVPSTCEGSTIKCWCLQSWACAHAEAATSSIVSCCALQHRCMPLHDE